MIRPPPRATPFPYAPPSRSHDPGVCQPATGTCTFAPQTGTSCNDGNACTQTDTCQNGTCVGGNPVTCGPAPECHDPGVCQPATGTCTFAPQTGTSCNDGNACTQTDTCQNGTCVGGNPVTCGPAPECHDPGVCQPATGTCTFAPQTGTSCNDGNACTQTDTCQNGTCVGGNPVTCGPATGRASRREREQISVAAASLTKKGTSCKDGIVCSRTGRCQSGACVGGTAVTCGEAPECHDPGVCQPATGTCTFAPQTGTSCNDGNACTQTDTCQNGTCVGGNPVTCGP